MIDAERLDRESASGAYRRRRCAGSVNLVRELRSAGKLSSAPPSLDAASGTRVHNAWSGNNVSLSGREGETLASLRRMEAELVLAWAGRDQHVLLGREQRLWMHQGFEPVHSGQFDVAYGTLDTKRMLIMDGKTLFEEVSPAESNDQLRELVALARLNFPEALEFTVAILQPWVTKEPSVAIYDKAEAELSLRLLRQTIADCADPDAPRSAGPWCRHCPAIGQCEEARAAVGATFRLAKRIEAGEFALPLGEAGTRFLDSVKTAETVLAALKSAYRQILLESPDAVPGWYMKEGKKVRQIGGVLATWELASQYMPLSQFLAASHVSVIELQTQFGSATGLKGEACIQRFNEVFAPVITLKEAAPELSRESARRGRHKELVRAQEIQTDNHQNQTLEST